MKEENGFFYILENLSEPIIVTKKERVLFANKSARDVFVTDENGKTEKSIKKYIENKEILSFLKEGTFSEGDPYIGTDKYDPVPFLRMISNEQTPVFQTH